MANSEGDQQLAGALHAILDKIELMYFKLQRSGIGNESSSRILFQKDSSYKCQFCTKIHASLTLVSEVWAKYIMSQPKF